MADKKLRTLQRDADRGDPQNEARLLIERVRAGQLTRPRLAMASRLGHPAAMIALPLETLPEDDVMRRLINMDLFDVIIFQVPLDVTIRIHVEILKYVYRVWMKKAQKRKSGLTLDGYTISPELQASINGFIQGPTALAIDDLIPRLQRFVHEDMPGDSVLALGSYLGIRCLEHSRIAHQHHRHPWRITQTDWATGFTMIHEVLRNFIELALGHRRARNPEGIAIQLIIESARTALLAPPAT